jgi:hypothetical protein
MMYPVSSDTGLVAPHAQPRRGDREMQPALDQRQFPAAPPGLFNRH